MRALGALGKSQQAADLADAFHNLPGGMWREDFSLQVFSDSYLAPYQLKYPAAGPKNYLAAVEKIIASR